MSRNELVLLRSEIGTIERFLRDLTEDDYIERMQLERRLGEARDRLAEFEARPRPKTLPITFRGQPVDGDRSIDANFASQAIKAFVDAADTVAASLLADELKDRGRLPGVGSRSLRIVDTVTGSFGFELELPPNEGQESLPLEGVDDAYSEALEVTIALLDQAATDDDEAISDLVARIHPRAAAKIRTFAKVLVDHHALFAAEFAGKQIRFDDETRARRVVDSLKDEDISEDDEQHVGVLLGVLPQSREFEAQLDDGTLIRGKIHRNVEDIAEFKQRWENESAWLHFRVIRVRVNRRHILTSASSLTPTEFSEVSKKGE